MLGKLGKGISEAMITPMLMKIKSSMIEQGIKSAFMYIDKAGKMALKTFKATHYVISEEILSKLPDDIQAEIKIYNGYDK